MDQREGESLREYIHRFCHKRNAIPNIDECAVIMYFKKRLKDPEFFRKLARKDVRTCEELFFIANQYALAEEAVLKTRKNRRDRKTSHHEKHESSRTQDKKKKSDCEVMNIERPRSPKPVHGINPTECADFLERKSVIHPQGNHKMKDCFKLDSLAEELLNAKKGSSSKKPEDHGGAFQKANREVNYIFGGLAVYESKRKQKLTY